MSYYDEEITISGSDAKQLSHIKVDRLPSSGAVGGGDNDSGSGSGRFRTGIGAAASGMGVRNRQSKLLHGSSADDDGLLQDIIDHDEDGVEEDEHNHNRYQDEYDSDVSKATRPAKSQSQPTAAARHSAKQRPLPAQRPPSTRIINLPTAKALDNDSGASESESDDDDIGTPTAANAGVGSLAHRGANRGTAALLGVSHMNAIANSNNDTNSSNGSTTADVQLSITPDKWEQLPISQDVKELFPYILKYTPQHIETPYHLQPFIPEYVPAVGDVDAFLKVTVPPLLQPQRQHEVNEHLRKLGLHCLDEPSGEQSEPSLLNMKLRSVLSGSGVNPRSASASLIPTAKSPKDIDKWIAEVEQVHMTHATYDAQPRKDMDALLLDWPRSYADATNEVQDAYQRCLREDISLTDYIRILCQRFGVEGAGETQADYILNVHTLFALYLAANQAWE